jgi:hypothetical protein
LRVAENWIAHRNGKQVRPARGLSDPVVHQRWFVDDQYKQDFRIGSGEKLVRDWLGRL